MRLDSIFADIASNVRHARVERKTKSKLASYRHSPELTYSRLYAYRRNPNGGIEVVPGEAAVVKLVFGGFAEGKNAQEIKRQLDSSDLRNRAGYRWTTEEITGLVRPIFAGLIPQRLGGFRRSARYQQLVSREMFEKAKRTAQMRVEGVEIVAPEPKPGGRSWNGLGIPVKGHSIQLSEAFLRTANRVTILAESAHGA
jgi:hypothetical protein